MNQAARFVESAPDGSVMVDAAVVMGLSSELRADVSPSVEHRGLGVLDWYAVNRADV